MGRNKVFVYSRIDKLVCTEAVVRPFKSPNSYLWCKIIVDLLYNIIILDDQFQRYNVAGGVDTLVGSSASHEGRLLGVVGVGFGDGACCDKSLEEVSFDCLLVMRSAAVSSGRPGPFE